MLLKGQAAVKKEMKTTKGQDTRVGFRLQMVRAVTVSAQPAGDGGGHPGSVLCSSVTWLALVGLHALARWSELVWNLQRAGRP